jgi:hypothetical protein
MAQFFWERGFDVWLLDLRTSPDLPSARYSWSFEDVAWADIPVAIEHVATTVQAERQAAQPVPVDVFAHCVGGLMLSMALLTDVHSQGFADYGHSVRQSTAFTGDHKLIYAAQVDRLPSRIRRVVLSQKSFALDYSDANVLRAYLMRYLRQWMPGNRYAFKPAMPPTTQDKTLDMLLAALPYPEHEFDRENPPFWKFWQRTPWTTTRHRMDALYEHTFNPNNLSDAVLASIDDFFGPININTISQILHIARHKVITTTEGKNIFVSASRLAARWPRGGTLGLHNSGNKMVDSATLKLTQQWMAGAGLAYVPLALSGLAHQDGLIGVDRAKTFAAVLEFLNQTAIPVTSATAAMPLALQPPWLGPRIKRFADGSVQILVGANPGVAQAEVVVLPVCRQNGTLTLAGVLPPGHLPSLPLNATHAFAPAAISASPALFGPPGAFVNAEPLIQHMLALQGLDPAAVDGVLVLVCTGQAVRLDINGGLVARLFDTLVHADKTACFIASAVYRIAPAPFPANGVAFAVGSCKYPSGVFDAVPATRAFRHMQALQPTARLQELLLLGDQIYADASAGLLDPSREDDRYQRPYEDLFRIPALRDLMRTIPVHMMLDDHEIVNNWAPGCSLQDALWFRQGVHAYWRYQRAEPRTAHLDLATQVCGFPLYMADTRTERAARTATTPQARIMGRRQSNAIQAWLLGLHTDPATRGQPKFISCASMLLPRPVGMAARPWDKLQCDSWSGYPASRDELLGFIAAHRIRGVVFLSGDEHVGNATEVSLYERGGECLGRVLSVHVPALYAPFPFANAAATDFAAHDTFTLQHSGNAYTCVVHARFAPNTNGFATLEVAPTVNGWQLRLAFHGEEEESVRTLFIV